VSVHGKEKACFAAGCFWHVELAFSKVEGVLETRVGYTGGWYEDPTYEDVCCGGTEHAEAVLITYDPELIDYERLLKIFWAIHDPTTLNRQGPDVGTQYRSAVFYFNEEQKKLAEASRQSIDESGDFHTPVVTEIRPAAAFYEAELYHQKYLEKKGATSC